MLLFKQASYAEFRRYKYCVDSVATRANIINSLEFIAGPKTSGGVIDRCLKLHVSTIQSECKYFISVKYITYDYLLTV